jgi:hypothetical protein
VCPSDPLLLTCLGDVAQALAHEPNACAWVKAECYRAPAALDLLAQPAQAPVLGGSDGPDGIRAHRLPRHLRAPTA